MRGRLVITLLVLAAPLGLAACGKSDEDKIRDVLDQVNSSDPAVCSKLSDQLLKAQFNGDKKRCEAQAKRVTDKKLFSVEKVKVDGDDATATVKAKQGGKSRVVFKKDGGDWKVQTIRPG